MTTSAKSSGLHDAKRAKNDEFYTRLEDIERELWHYREHFRGRTVLCNCDDPRASKFHHFFRAKFKPYGLKKLITTCYKNQNPDIFSAHKCERAVCLEYNGCKTGRPRYLEGDGDFRRPESVELLKKADIVVTNPPFSLFREYIAQLMEHDKKFLILGNMNALTYREVFALVKADQVWLGNNNGPKKFGMPEHAEKYHSVDNGKKFMEMGNVIWYTNLPHNRRNQPIDLFGTYEGNESDFPKYDNYDAIEVDKVADIPRDYPGVMGVPVTFMDKYCPTQFEIVGLAGKVGFGLTSHKFYDDFVEVRQDGTLTGSSGKKTNGNPVMSGMPDKNNYFQKDDEIVHSLYSRIFIRHKHPVG